MTTDRKQLNIGTDERMSLISVTFALIIMFATFCYSFYFLSLSSYILEIRPHFPNQIYIGTCTSEIHIVTTCKKTCYKITDLIVESPKNKQALFPKQKVTSLTLDWSSTLQRGKENHYSFLKNKSRGLSLCIPLQHKCMCMHLSPFSLYSGLNYSNCSITYDLSPRETHRLKRKQI